MIQVKGGWIYRLIARAIPLKHKWDFLIGQYLKSKELLLIPFHRKYAIAIAPNLNNQRTISDLIFEGARYLPEYALVQRVCRMLPNDYVYVDVGANIGTTVWIFAGGASRVVAFEPIPRLSGVIDDSIRLNQVNYIELRRKAIGNSVGELVMLDNENSSVASANDVGTIRVGTSTLDHELMNERRIDLMKVDVEGFEFQVLQGAKSVLERFRPKLLVEIHPANLDHYGDSVSRLLDQLEQMGYGIEYYLFLEDIKKSRVHRFVSRYLKSGTQFETRAAFMEDIESRSGGFVYHIFCDPGK